MAVSVREGALEWIASINTDKIQKDVDKITAQLTGVAKDANKTVEDFTKKTVLGVNQLTHSIETLRAKILVNEEFVIKTTDLNKIAVYNKEIEALKLQITQILSAGRTGFDNFGVAIKTQVGLLERLQRQAQIYKNAIQQATLPANIAKYNAKLEATNLQLTKLSNAGKKGFDEIGNATSKLTSKVGILSKGFSFFRQAAFLIPGLGIAGIFNLIGQGVAALVTELFKSNGALKTFAQNFKNVVDVMAAANKESGKQITDLKILYKAATDVNLSMKERLDAVNALQVAFPEFFGNIKDEIILNGEAQKAYDDLTLSIQNSSRARAAKAKIDEIAAQKLDIAFQKLKIESATAAEKARAKEETFLVSGGGFAQGTTGGTLKQTKLEAQAIIEARRLKAIRDQEKKEVSLDQQEKFLIRFVGEKNITKAVIDEHKARKAKVAKVGNDENEIIALLEKRKKILEGIIDLERDAVQSGLSKEASEIDKLNEKREKQLQGLNEINDIIKFINKQKGLNIPLIGQDAIDRINVAFETIKKNTIYKEDAAKYLEAVKLKEAAFDELEKAQLTGNQLIADQARDLYKDQTGDFTSMVDFLMAEHKRLFDALAIDPKNVGLSTSLEGITKLLDTAVKKRDADEKKRRAKNFEDFLAQTKSFKQREIEINDKYNKLEATLQEEQGRFSPQELAARRQILKDARQKELDDVKDDAAAALEEIKKLFLGIDDISDKAARKVINDAELVLETLVKEGKISVEFANQIRNTLAKTTEALDERLPKRLKQLAASMADLSTAAAGFDNNLATALDTLSQMISAVADVKKGISDFKDAQTKGDAVGQVAAGLGIVGSIIGAVSSVINIFKKAREERKKHEKEVGDFLTAQFIGEQEINLLYQERARQQILINKLRIQGLNDEKKLLLEQRNEVVENYKTIFDELQKQTFKVLKQNLSLFGPRSIFVDESLFGKSFDELEQLFLKGQLEGKAKDLFLQLQKIKDAGVDIDRMLEDNKRAVQELFTGTTADGIIDSIAEGFASGERSAEDFADNFQDLMRAAIIQSLKFKFLEGPLKKFFEDFAAATQSDEQLTTGEIERLQATYNTIIKNAADQFDQLQQIAGINFNSQTGAGNTLTGAIRGITEQQADLLAGQFGGLRITAIEQLRVAMRGIETLQKIEVNTARLIPMYDLWRRIELNGLKAL